MLVDHLGADPGDDLGEAKNKLDRTKDAHARFDYLKKIYENEILRAQQVDGDDEQVALHISNALRAYLLYLVGTLILWTRVPLI